MTSSYLVMTSVWRHKDVVGWHHSVTRNVSKSLHDVTLTSLLSMTSRWRQLNSTWRHDDVIKFIVTALCHEMTSRWRHYSRIMSPYGVAFTPRWRHGNSAMTSRWRHQMTSWKRHRWCRDFVFLRGHRWIDGIHTFSATFSNGSFYFLLLSSETSKNRKLAWPEVQGAPKKFFFAFRRNDLLQSTCLRYRR